MLQHDQIMLWVALATLFISIMLFCYWFLFNSKHLLDRYKRESSQVLDRRLSSMFLFFDAKQLIAIKIIASVIIPLIVYLLTHNIPMVIGSLVLIIVVPELMVRLLEMRRLNQFEDDLPMALTQIAGSMRAGVTLVNAIDNMSQETKGPVGDEFALLVREYKLGKSFESAFIALTNRVNSNNARIVLAAASIANEVGGNLAETFERLAEMLTQKKMMEDKIKSLTAQGKLQGVVVGALPIGMIFMISQIEPDFLNYLTMTYLGWMFIAVMSLLLIAGFIMIRKIVTIDV